MEDRRIVIVDYNHMAHQYMNSKAPRLFKTEHRGNVPYQIETTIPAYTIKALHRFCRQGKDTLAVCFDSPCSFRKNYFSEKSDINYKGDRKSMPSMMYDGINLTVDVLSKAGVSIYKAENYEADDLVYSLVMKCKETYPNTPIDVVTNDADLVPLVDEQVSVFLKSRQFTYSTEKSIEKMRYMQVTPYNYEEVIGNLSKYKKFDMAYNTMLLHKLLRGDDSDCIPELRVPETGRPDFPPKMYNELIAMLTIDGVDMDNIFRYTTFKPIHELGQLQYHNPQAKMIDAYNKKTKEQIDKMCAVLGNYVDDYTLEHIRFIYGGMNLRFLNLVLPQRYDEGVLRLELSKLNINLPISK